MTITQGARLLREWLEQQGKNQEWLAAQLTSEREGKKVYQSTVSSWLRGAEVPLWGALAIEKITGISPSEWVPHASESRPGPVDVEDCSLHGRSSGAA